MLYIHQSICLSPQNTFGLPDLASLQPVMNGQLRIVEPPEPPIPAGVLRRMGKAVKMSVTAALPLLKEYAMPEGIILGTGNGGMEDSIHFLHQLIQYDEGMLTPGHFVQSTANSMAAQISMLSGNHHYNTTHVHRGLAFENALLDAFMLTAENKAGTFLLGAVDEISAYNDNIERLAGAYKASPVSNDTLYDQDSAGSIAGEGAVMFLVSGRPEDAHTCVPAIRTLHTEDETTVQKALIQFLDAHLKKGETIGWLLSGENGDNRLSKYYAAAESAIPGQAGIARFKHMSGEYPTSSAMAVWLSCFFVTTQTGPPTHMIKRPAGNDIKNILIYNNYKGTQHSFILVTKP